METPLCPHCGRSSQVESHYSVFLGPKDLPLTLVFTAIVLMASHTLELSGWVAAGAVAIAVAPLFISFFHKYFCGLCEIEFQAPRLRTPPVRNGITDK